MGAWDDETQTFSDRGKLYSHPYNSVVPFFEAVSPDLIGMLSTPQVWRIIEVQPDDPFCIVELSVGANSYFAPVVDSIHRFAKCDHVSFLSKYAGINGEVARRSFGISRDNENVRYVEIEQNIDGEGGRPDWSFNASGTVQSWEESEQYKSRVIGDRLPDDLLKRYMREFGLKYEIYENRRFSRVIDSADTCPQEGLIEGDLTGFDKEAKIIGTWLREMIEDLSEF